jgi:hypothetical protein
VRGLVFEGGSVCAVEVLEALQLESRLRFEKLSWKMRQSNGEKAWRYCGYSRIRASKRASPDFSHNESVSPG